MVGACREIDVQTRLAEVGSRAQFREGKGVRYVVGVVGAVNSAHPWHSDRHKHTHHAQNDHEFEKTETLRRSTSHAGDQRKSEAAAANLI